MKIAKSLLTQTIHPINDTPADTTTSMGVPNNTAYPDDVLADKGSGWGAFLFISIVLIAVGVGLYFLIRKLIEELKYKDVVEKSKDGVLMEIMVKKDNETEIQVAERLFANLYGLGGQGDGIMKYFTVKNSISFELVGLPRNIRFYVYAPKKFADLVEKQILGTYQDAQVNIVEEYNIFDEQSKVSFASLKLADKSYYPIKVAEDFTGDPLANILSVLSDVDKGEGIAIQFVISPAGKKWQKSGNGYVNKVEKNNADPEKTRMDVSQEKLQAIKKKTSKIGFRTDIRIVTSASSKEIADMLLTNVISAFDQFSNPDINHLEKRKVKDKRRFMFDFIYRRLPLDVDSVFNVEELATMYHLPNKDITIPNINWLLARDFPAADWVSSDVNSKDTIWIGDNIFRGVRKRICFKRDDRRRHAYLLGQTGSGKSWLLTRMIMQDIYNGDGVCFIDPHGQTAEMVLERIPKERAEDVIYFNVADYERPFGFNIMEWRTEEDKHRIVNSFIALLKKLYDPNNQGIVGPILERAVRNSMLTVMTEHGSTLIEVLRVITDNDWVNKKWLPLIKDDLVRRYWTDQIAKTNDFHKSETLGYITSKFDRFVTNLVVRNIIGQSESSFDMRKVMDEGKILIVNLSKGLIGEENMQFLGLLLIPKMVRAALSREDIPEDQRRDFFFYVDEFQNFASDEFASILSEARKYRLNLTVANQYIAQMQETVRDAVFGNVGTLLIARTGPSDAEFLEKQFAPTITASDLMNQPNIHWYAKMIVDGKYPPPFSIDTRYGPAFPESGFDLPVNKKIKELIIKISRLKYGRDVNLVKENIDKRAELSTKKDDSASKAKPPLTLK